MTYKIVPLNPKDYTKCNNIWDMQKNAEQAKKWLDEIRLGNRIVFIYTENGKFIGEGALVFDNGDRDYTIPGRRVYLSRMIVKQERRNQGIGSIILDFLIEKARLLGFAEMALGVDKANTTARHLYKKKGFNTVIFDGADEYGEYVKLLKHLDDTTETVIHHYNALIDENNDPVHDPEPLQKHMNKWDGNVFIEAMQLTANKSVLEVGVGTGRLALRVCGKCESFTGIDISQKTIERANQNLKGFQNIRLICADYMTYTFDGFFDVIYSTLTFMHIKDKQAAIQKAWDLLIPSGRFVLSIDKNRKTEIDYGTRKIPVFPDNPEEIGSLLTKAGFTIEQQLETEFAVVFSAVKGVGHLRRAKR